MNVDQLRKDFPILDQTVNGHPLCYLDSGASTQKPVAVIEAMNRYYREDHSNVHRGLHTLSNRATDQYEKARIITAEFLHAARPEEILFTRGTTEGINLVSHTWGEENIGPGDVILLTEMEHHSNLVPWQILARRKGATVRYVPIHDDTGHLDLAEVAAMLTPEVKLFAFPHISNTLGVIHPVGEFCRLARERGITTLIDGAQAAGHQVVDMQAIGCDFYAFGAHKVAGPTGVGVLYGRYAILEEMPPFHGGGEMIAKVTYEGATWKKPPHRFEAGTPMIAEVIGLGAALRYLETIGREAIAEHDKNLAAYAYERLSTLDGIRLLGPTGERAGLVTFHFEDVHAHDVVTFADQEGIALRGGHHCTQPLMAKLGLHSTTRASFYLYSTREEVDRLAANLQKTLKFFRV